MTGSIKPKLVEAPARRAKSARNIDKIRQTWDRSFNILCRPLLSIAYNSNGQFTAVRFILFLHWHANKKRMPIPAAPRQEAASAAEKDVQY